MQASPRIDELRQKFHENPRRYFAPLANEYRKAGDPEQAIAICRAHLAQQPGHMSGHVVYGQALYDAHRTEEARLIFEKARTLDPDNAIVLRYLADIAREKGETAEARHWYTQALEADPQNTELAAYIAELTEPLSGEESEQPEVKPETETPASATAPIEPVAPEPAAAIEAAAPVETPSPVEETSGELESQPDEDETPWRKTPPQAEPFVTRTMAELYASQGYNAAALDVFRQLAIQHPDDKDIQGRIDALVAKADAESKTPPLDLVAEPEPDVDEAPLPSILEAPAGEAPPEPVAGAVDIPFEPITEFEPLNLEELPNEVVYAPSTEDLALESDDATPEAPAADAPHFTEMDIQSAGDSWDADAWGEGFSDDTVVADTIFDIPDTLVEPPAPAAEIAAEFSVEEPPVEEPPVEAPSVEAPSVEAPSVEEEPHLVAYSPQLPDDHELPHFVPKGRTVREFFAEMGARKPPSREPRASFTARAEVPGVDSQPETAPAPEASSLATLFSDDTIGDDDNRAAFALSGAVGAVAGSPTATANPDAPAPAAATAPAATPPAAQESEEDIRRFREWLDGLAES